MSTPRATLAIAIMLATAAPLSASVQLQGGTPGARVTGVVVGAATRAPASGATPRASVRAGIGDEITVFVENLRELKQRSSCLNDQRQATAGCTPHAISLYLDDRELTGVVAEAAVVDDTAGSGRVEFHLRRSTQSDQIWSDLLGNPPLGDSTFWYRPTALSVGLAGGGGPVPTAVTSDTFKLIRIHPAGFYAGFVVMIIFVVFFARYAHRSDCLRDAGPNPAVAGQLKPYSLARCQMAWWFFLVVASFLFIFLVTQSYDTINSTVLILIGISSGTFLAASAVDSSDQQSTAAAADASRAAIAKLNIQVASLQSQVASPVAGADLPTLKMQLAAARGDLSAALATAPVHPTDVAPRVSKNLIDDILTDRQGQSFHRFQMVVWTIVLGIVFVVSVWQRLSMPAFSATLLGLLGISGGTYVGFKFPENQASNQANNQARNA